MSQTLENPWLSQPPRFLEEATQPPRKFFSHLWLVTPNFAPTYKTLWISEKAWLIKFQKFLQVIWPEFRIRTNRHQNVPKPSSLLGRREKINSTWVSFSFFWTRALSLYPWRRRLQPARPHPCLASENARLKESLGFSGTSSRKTSCGLGTASRSCDPSMKKTLRWASNRFTSGGGTRPERGQRREPPRSKTAIRRTKPQWRPNWEKSALFHSRMSSEGTQAD